MALIQKAFSDIITFSRSSNATRVGPTGLVEYAPHNLLTYSQDFSNAAWEKGSGFTLTANAIAAPDGTVTADLFTRGSTSLFAYLAQVITGNANQSITFSCWVRTVSGSSTISLVISDYLLATLPSADLSIDTTWRRLSFTVNAGQLSNTTYIGVGFLMGAGQSAYFWGAQLAVGPYALDYTPTTSAAVYGPRFDFDPTTLAAKGLLVEEQRTNLFTYSEQLNNVIWSTAGNVTITANAAVAPDGTTTADTMTEVATNATHRIEYITSGTSVANQYTVSFYVKVASGAPWFRLSFTDSSGAHQINAWFDLTNGVNGSTSVVGSGVIASHSITAVGNGWYRCVMTGTVTGGTGVVYSYTGLANANLAISYLGSTSRAVYLWGAQLEAGSFATSYIPTLASTVTRSADVASVNTLSPWFNATEGTLFAECDFLSNTAGSSGVVALGDGTTNENIAIYKLSSAQIMVGEVLDGGAAQATFTQSFGTQVVKSTFAYKANDFNMATNGVAGTTDTSGTLPTVSTMFLGNVYSTTSFPMSGHLRRIAYYPVRLTNAQLQALTS